MPAPRSIPAPTASDASFDAQQRMLRRYLHVLGAPADRIDDLCQEAIALSLEKDIGARAEIPLAGWLRVTARNLLLRQWDSVRRRREVELADQIWTEAHEGLEDQDRVRALRDCVEALPERSRTMLRRVYAENAGRTELGRELGITPNTVKSTLRRLRESLRQCIERRLEPTP